MTRGEGFAVLKGGVRQEIAEAHTLYHAPVNQFVAGFICSPPMNFLPARVAEDGSVALQGAAAFRPEPAPTSLSSPPGRPRILGVRPQDLSLPQSGAGRSLAANLH